MTILAPGAPKPPTKLKIHAEQAFEAVEELLTFLHKQESPWHPAEINFVLITSIHAFCKKHGIALPEPIKAAKAGKKQQRRGR